MTMHDADVRPGMLVRDGPPGLITPGLWVVDRQAANGREGWILLPADAESRQHGPSSGIWRLAGHLRLDRGQQLLAAVRAARRRP